MNISKLTFVTSFVDIYDTTFEDKTVDWRFDKFRDIATTGIQLCVYVSPECYDNLAEFSKPYENVKIMRKIHIADTFVAKSCENIDYELPIHRNAPKDIPSYMMLINSKTEFMCDAIEQNPWESTHFAWIDFSISYVFHKKSETLHYLRTLSTRTFSPKFLVIPGCWDKIGAGEMSQIANSVYWRYCGGFLLGDAASILDMHQHYLDYYPNYIQTHKHLVWEVNFWAWLEANTDWAPTWYKADHNDCILHIPIRTCSVSLNGEFSKTIQYDYPKLETYEPSSACYVYYNGKHYLNTRYVNYWYLDSGHCSIKHPEDFIISRNMVSELDVETLVPINYNEMQESTVGLLSNRCYFYGLEDIRLYVENGHLKFIATNIDYSPTGCNRMIVGNYHPETASYSDCRITVPPYDTWCEKNWIPIVTQNANTGNEETFFIYKWFPLEIGKMQSDTNKLEIVHRHIITAPEFHRVRGSSPFIDGGDCWLGIVHFSENTLPRQYYHIMVSLDKQTFMPLKYSQIFHFQHIGIEFCIGFAKRDDEYLCWVSKNDREPAMVSFPVCKIPLMYDF